MPTGAMRTHDHLVKRQRRLLEDHLDTVRAIRADHTLDLTRHLVEKVGGGSEGTDDSVSRSRSRFRRPQDGPSSRVRTRTQTQKNAHEDPDGWVDEGGQSASGAKTPDGERGESSMWTRWPLLRGDVHVPEWTLQDEVEALVERFFREDAEAEVTATNPTGMLPALSEPGETLSNTPKDAMEVEDQDQATVQSVALARAVPLMPKVAGQTEESDDTDLADDRASSVTSLTSDPALTGLTPITLHSVTESTRTWLNSLLRAVALARPVVHHTVLYRAPPSDWITVLEIAGASGLVGAETIRYVQEVMEDVSRPASLRVLDRLEILDERATGLECFAAEHMQTLDAPPLRRGRPKARKPKYKGHPTPSASASEVDVNSADDACQWESAENREGQPRRFPSRRVIEDSDEEVERIPVQTVRVPSRPAISLQFDITVAEAQSDDDRRVRLRKLDEDDFPTSPVPVPVPVGRQRRAERSPRGRRRRAADDSQANGPRSRHHGFAFKNVVAEPQDDSERVQFRNIDIMEEDERPFSEVYNTRSLSRRRLGS